MMRWLIPTALTTLAAWPAAAQDAEAEKLYRAMEKKVRAAKTLHVRFGLTVTDAASRKWDVKGSLTLGGGDCYRVELDGKLFGEAVKVNEVSDGTRVKTTGAPDAAGGKEESPKGAGAYFRAALPREGFFLSSLNLNQRGDPALAARRLVGFTLAGKEKVGGCEAAVVRYALADRRGKEAVVMKVWIDPETSLPVKFAMTGGKSDIAAVVETYGEFNVDPKVDAKTFEVSK